MKDRVRQTAAELGLPFGERDKTYNSRLAQELGKWAESRHTGDAFHTAAFRTYFVDGNNISNIMVLIDIAESAGLPRDEALSVLEARSFREAVDDDWALAKGLGITAIPTFVMNEGRLVGAQPYEMLREMMESSGIKKHINH